MTPYRAGLFAALAVAVVAATGCALPQWRVFQKTVDPTLAQKPVEQTEAERRGAKYIAQRSASVEANPSAQLAAIHSVAIPLSSSLGEPRNPVSSEDQSKIIAELGKGLLAEQKKAEQWRAFALKYAGKPLEDTGINLAGPAGVLALAALVALCVACPAVGYVLLRALPLLWGFFSRTTEAVAEFAKENPDAGQKLAVNLRGKMDAAHKRLVRARANASRIPLVTASE